MKNNVESFETIILNREGKPIKAVISNVDVPKIPTPELTWSVNI